MSAGLKPNTGITGCSTDFSILFLTLSSKSKTTTKTFSTTSLAINDEIIKVDSEEVHYATENLSCAKLPRGVLG